MSLPRDPDLGTPARRSEALVTLSIDGFEVRVPEGTSVMRAAESVGCRIPRL
jgi:formate dehydrogenase major subunit